MNQQTIDNIPGFAKEMGKMSQAIYLACDPEVAADVCLKTRKAVKLIEDLAEENRQLRDAYHDLTGNRWEDTQD